MMGSPSFARPTAGFTLVESLMVILVLGILATIAITQYTDFSTDARKAVTLEKLGALKTAIIGDPHFYSAGEYTKPGYQAHCGGPPAALADLMTQPGAGVCAAVYDPFKKIGWRGPYVSTTDASWNLDGWGVAIQYFVAGPPARTLRSCGPDNVCGNTDDISVTF